MILLTASLATSGFDWWFYQQTRDPTLLSWMFWAGRIGFLLPMLLPLYLLLAGYGFKAQKIIISGWAMIQAELLGSLISSTYKAFSGRAHPLRHSDQDISQVFHFGFMQGGVFWGWPSSHTTIAFAMAVTVCTIYAKSRWLQCLAIAYAIYIGLGVAMTIHWFSDFVAGAILGTMIGLVVGKGFGSIPALANQS